MKNIFLMGMMLLLLTNCSVVAKRKWNCKAETNPYGCTSIKEIDDNIESENISNLKGDSVRAAISSGRSHEKVGRIYIAPYIDSNNHYHEGEYIKFIEQSPDWKYEVSNAR